MSKQALAARNADIRSTQGEYIGADVTRDTVRELASVDAVRHILPRRNPKQNVVPEKYITEGKEVIKADSLHTDDITGVGARIAVIDHYFHTESPKYKDNIVATIGPDAYFTTSTEYSGTKQHGTACAEIVSDIAPGAELILVSTQGSRTFDELMTEIESYSPDAATMSLGFDTQHRIDGRDPISQRVADFTSDGRLFATSAGNAADGGHWDSPFRNDGNGLMIFDTSLTEPTRFPVLMDPINRPAEVHIHWDADWSQDNQRYEARLYDTPTSTTALDTSQTTNPVEVLQLTPSQHGTSGASPYYVEIENVGATGTEHFDLFHWGRAVFDKLSTPERSLGIPATSRDEDTLAVAAVQATSYGAQPSAGKLKAYSSRGPTQDGRRGLDLAAPSVVSTTKIGEYGGYGAIEENGGGFGGTSAAAPHLGGAFGLLFGSDIGVPDEEALRGLFSVRRDITDKDVPPPSSTNTVIGHGYIDAKATADGLAPFTPLTQVWASNSLGSAAQYSQPAVDTNQVYVGGLQNAVYALNRADGTTVSWQYDRGSELGLSDSSPLRSGDVVYIGSGQGKLHALNTVDGSEYWTDVEIPYVGSAITTKPVVNNGIVYAGTNDGVIHAWDSTTGAQQWSQVVGKAVYSDLIIDMEFLYVTTTDGKLVVLYAGNGNIQWEASFEAFGSTSPTVGGNRVYVADDEVHAFETGAVKSKLWSSSGFDGDPGSGLDYSAVTDTVYVGSGDGALCALNGNDGTVAWSEAIDTAVESAPAVNGAGTRIVVTTVGGALRVFNDSGTELDNISIDSSTRASPVVFDGTVYFGDNEGVIHAIE